NHIASATPAPGLGNEILDGRRHLQGSPSTRGAILPMTTSAASCRPRNRSRRPNPAALATMAPARPLRTMLFGAYLSFAGGTGIRDGLERCPYRGPPCTHRSVESSSSRCFTAAERSLRRVSSLCSCRQAAHVSAGVGSGGRLGSDFAGLTVTRETRRLAT